MLRLNSTRGILTISFAAFVVYGMSDAVLGTGWPFIRAELGRPVGDLGLLIAVGVVGFATLAAVSGSVTTRLGTGGSLVVAYAAIGSGALLFAVAGAWWHMLAAALSVGSGAGLLDPVINSYMARVHDLRMMNLLHTSYGAGATLAPLVVIAVVERFGSWRWAYAGVAGWAALMLLVVVRTRRTWGGPGPVPAGTTVGTPQRGAAVWILLAGFMFTAGTEITTGQWAFSVLSEGRELADAAAAAFTAAFWAGLTLVRFAGVFVGDRWPRPVLLRMSATVLVAGIAWFALDPGGLGAWGLPVAGGGSALAFPLLVTISSERYGGHADRVIGWGFTGAAVGGVSFPWIAGQLAERLGFGAVGPFLVATSMGVLVVSWLVFRAGRTAAPAPIG